MSLLPRLASLLLLALLAAATGCGERGQAPAAVPPRTMPQLPEKLPPWRYEGTPPAPRARPETNPPKTAADLADAAADGNRCREGVRTRLYLLDGEALALDLEADRALQLPGTLEISERRGGERGLPLDALLEGREGATGLEAWPCRGEPLVLTREALEAEPGRWVLLLSRQKGFKLVDRSEEGGGRPVLRNLAAVRILR